MSVSRRGFLKGSALGAGALVLGWRPSLPAPVAPAVAVVEPVVVAGVPGVVKLASFIPVSNELLEDMAGIESLIRERLTASLAEAQDDLILGRCLDEQLDSSEEYGWHRNETAFRLTQEWEVTVTPELAERMAAEAMA